MISKNQNLQIGIWIALLILISSALYSQEFKKLRAGAGLGVGYNPSAGGSGMILFYFEPSYHVIDQFTLGIRVQNSIDVPQGKNIVSFALVSQYYFSNKQFRPFAGIGAGIYKDSTSPVGSTSSSGQSISFFPRVGFDVGHFNLIADFDVIGSITTTDYLTLKIGMTVGGGRKKIK